MLTLQELKNRLNYDESTGIFTWKDNGTYNVKSGDIAGCVTKIGYRVITLKGKPYKAHRLAWLYVYGKFPEKLIDHINHNKDDNRIVNLREVDIVENARNMKVPANNKSSVIGVHWHRETSKWRAQIKVKGEQIHLGYFDSFADACKVRKEAEKLYDFHKNHGSSLC